MSKYDDTKRKVDSTKRPGLGSGLAEKAAKSLEGRKSRLDQAIDSMSKGKKKKKNDY